MTSQSDTLQMIWDKLEETIIWKAFGMFTSSRRMRLGVIDRLETIEQINGSAATNIFKCTKVKAAALRNNKRAQADKKMLDITQQGLKSPRG